jgi:hypothetical protein
MRQIFARCGGGGRHSARVGVGGQVALWGVCAEAGRDSRPFLGVPSL